MTTPKANRVEPVRQVAEPRFFAVRISLFLIGGAGWVGTTFLLARASWWFVSTGPDGDGAVRPDRAFGLGGAWLRVAAVGAPVTPLGSSDRRVLAIGAAAIAVALALTPVWTL